MGSPPWQTDEDGLLQIGRSDREKMEEYKKQFIDFMIDSHVLKFGDFTLKSGRKSPFFMNAGAYVTGSQLKKLGEFYARAIHDSYGNPCKLR